MATLTINIDNKIKSKVQSKTKKEGITMTFLVSQLLKSYADGLVSFGLSVKDNDSAYFYTKEWQKMEREADEDIKKGRISGPFTTAKDLISHLKKA